MLRKPPLMLLAALMLVAAASVFGPTPASSQAAAPPPQMGTETADPFGEEVTLSPKTIVYLKGQANWDSAYDTLVEAFKTVNAFLDKHSLKADGPKMTVYTSTDDTGFQFQAGIPIAEEPKELPSGDISVGKSPSGRALKFVHRGSYDAMDATYDAITNYLDEKKLEAKDLFVEQYITDPVTTAEDKLVVEVYVPIK